ncbi:MobA/MobL family protein, partial [Xanthomonas arboricola]|uniref:MobA/MobL family protein n=2 Tax=Xanthomonas TaxID=338 RepID=UPI0021578C05
MAIHHTRIKTYSRAKGHSAIAAAAYRGGYLLTDPKSDARHDYRGRAGIIQSRCLAPLSSPAWADDPQALWAAAEAAERRCNCNDPLNSCSGVTFPEGDTDERSDGRRDQA